MMEAAEGSANSTSQQLSSEANTALHSGFSNYERTWSWEAVGARVVRIE